MGQREWWLGVVVAAAPFDNSFFDAEKQQQELVATAKSDDHGPRRVPAMDARENGGLGRHAAVERHGETLAVLHAAVERRGQTLAVDAPSARRLAVERRTDWVGE